MDDEKILLRRFESYSFTDTDTDEVSEPIIKELPPVTPKLIRDACKWLENL